MTTRREREQQMVVEGRVVADFGREFLVELADRRQIVCTRRGKKQDATCGDFVEARLTGSAQGSIERVGTRRNLLYRSDQWREKTLAANVDQVVILLAPKPPFSEAFLNLSLVACEAARIPVIIALNKSDLPEHAESLKTLRVYEAIGYTIISMSAKFETAQPLMPHLEKNLTLLVGQSGMGKSRTVNALLMSDVARVGDLTASLESGAQTTTFSRIYRLDRDTAIIDTPGFPNRSRFRTRLLQGLVAGPELVAEQVVRAVERNRLEQFVPRWYRPAAILQAAAPGLLARAARASAVRRKRK